MFRSLLCKAGVTLKRTATIINVESSSSSSLSAQAAKYFLFPSQNPNAVISNSRVTSSIFNSFCTTTGYNSNSSFVVSYLINSCGLSETEAITASKKLSFKYTLKPDSVLALLRTYGFTESHISKVINKCPSILQLQTDPSETLKPKLDFFVSKGLRETDLADVISGFPGLLARGLDKEIIPSFDLLKSIVQSDENVVAMVKRNSWVLSADRVKRVMVIVERLRNEGVPETNISRCLIQHPRLYTASRFEEILEKVKQMGLDPLQISFLKAMHMLTTMSEDSLRRKMDVYKRLGGWSEDQVQSAFRKKFTCMKASEEKIVAVMNFLVNEMGYDSSSLAENPVVFCCSLQGRNLLKNLSMKFLDLKGYSMVSSITKSYYETE